MNSRTHLGFATLAFSFAALAAALGACSSDSFLGDETGAKGPGGGASFSVGGAGPSDTSSSSGSGTGGAGAGYGSPEAGDMGGAGPAGAGGGNEAPIGGGGGGNPFQNPPSPECTSLPMEPRVVYMSADDSNSMGSPVLVRELIRMGFEPNPAIIRTYEFLNYYQIAYDPAAYDTLAIYPHLEQRQDNLAVADMQIAVRSFNSFPSRRPMNITFVIDTSGSMKGPGLARAKATVDAMSAHFISGDRISVVTWSDPPKMLDGYVLTSDTDTKVKDFVNALEPIGSTDLSTALSMAYSIAKKYAAPTQMNRVVLISDGGVSAGISDKDYIAEQTSDAEKEGVYLVGVGTGPALSYNDSLMNAVTDAGRGAYVYLDSTEEAYRIFGQRFDETMDIAAREVQVELTLPYYFLVKGLSTEVISPKPVTAQHLAPNDAMIFNLETTACHPDVYGYSDEVKVRVSWKTRTGYQERFNSISPQLKTIKSSTQLLKGRAIVSFANALKGCIDEKVCTETKRMAVTKEKLLVAREHVLKADPSGTDAELLEILSLIDAHPLFQ